MYVINIVIKLFFVLKNIAQIFSHSKLVINILISDIKSPEITVATAHPSKSQSMPFDLALGNQSFIKTLLLYLK